MKLSKLLQNVKVEKIIKNADVEVLDVCIDSNVVVNGSVFICIKGGNFDGHQFVKQAEKYGAVAVVCEREVQTSLTQIIVKNTRKIMGILASNFYNNPEKELKLIGVTGTNGKTSTAHLISKVLNSSGINTGVIGTLGTFYNEIEIEANLTTPDPIVLYRIFRDMVDKGVKIAVMEISAHATYLDKLEGLSFDCGIFTNFTQDHLDFFENMENYAKAKKNFFLKNKIKNVILNVDDDLGIDISKSVESCITYGIENPADVFAIDIEHLKNQTSFVVNLFDEVFITKTKLKGRFNVYNYLACATACCIMGVKPKNIVTCLEKVPYVTGRLEPVYEGEFDIYVDYAHTPDGLRKSLTAIKQITRKRLICVFGCGGNRDSDKREKMGEISAELADFTVITSDNPRFEEPMEIIWQIEKGLLKISKNYIIVQEREQAIEYAINVAKKGDVLLIAGKGSEKYQEVFGIKKPYNDKDTDENILRNKM